MKREEVIEVAKVGGMKASFGKTTDGKYAPNVNALGSSIPVEWLEAAFTEVERRTIEKCVAVIQSYQIPYGNSAAGEIAAEMTLSMLREVRDEIRALANQQEKQ